MSPDADHAPSRRQFLTTASTVLTLPWLARRATAQEAREPLRWGLIADLHHGLAPTAQERLEQFISDAIAKDVDGIVQLGDFNYGTSESKPCMDAWNQFRGERFHVLGNHDMDKVDKPTVQDCWEMEQRYGSFDRSGFHFVVLDRNHLRVDGHDIPYSKANFYVPSEQRGFADREQLEWLAGDLASTTLPVVVFVHQGLGMTDDLPDHDPRSEIEAILSAARRPGAPGVVACFCGHEHLDRHRQKDGIHYVWINSASYHWVGADYGRMAHYDAALYAFVTFDPAGTIRIEGRDSDWVEPSPADRGYPNADQLSTSITHRALPFPGA